ncbi:MAG: urease accessory protein UreD [Acidobacteriia bacterium]|nr:urease accessory protein UreD [Terriglobia bacterium]
MKARLALRFEASGQGTRLRVETQEPPWKVIRAFPQANGGALVHLHNVSGGILAGDLLSLQMEVGCGARAQVTTTGATRLYRHRPGAACSEQRTEIFVAEGGLLEYLPDPLIPFGRSRHTQRTAVQLASGARFFWWEIVAPGRQAMGELFAFDSLRIDTSVSSALRPLMIERFLLEPGVRMLRSAARTGPYLYNATFCAIQVGRTMSDLRELESLLAESTRTATCPGVMMWGASALAADGVIVRGLSTTARGLPATLAQFWSIARRFLTGEEAVPPRKLK